MMKKQLERYFNDMAIIIRNILNDSSLFSSKDFQSILNDDGNITYLKLISDLPQLIRENKMIRDIRLHELDELFFEKIYDFIKSRDMYLLMLLLYYLDRSIESCYKNLVGFEDDVETYHALNSNYYSTQIVLIKKTKCKWSPRQIGNNLNGILSNFYYIDKQKLGNMDIVHHILDENLIRNENDVLRLALSPITKEKMVEFSKPYMRENEKTGANQYYFRVEKVLHEKMITEQIIKNIYEAGRRRTNILVFPEMLGTRNMLDMIIDELSDRDNGDIPQLVVFPSIWEKTENDVNNVNKSCMILNGEEILFEQNKYCDFNYEWNDQPVYEDINRTDKNSRCIHLLHIEGLGRICIIICYDYLDTDNRDVLIKNLYPTLVCSPSFSTGSFNFGILAESYFSQGCNWIWCNTCSAAHETAKKQNFEIVGLMTTLNKHCDLTKLDEIKTLCNGQINCNKETCDNCIYYADIPLTV